MKNHQSTQNQCKANLDLLAQKVGAIDAAFLLDFTKPSTWLGKHWLDGIKLRQSLLYSSPEVEFLLSKSRSCMTKLDKDIINAVEKPMHVWFVTPNTKQQLRNSDTLRTLGFGKQISISVPLFSTELLQGSFSFFYEDGDGATDVERMEKLHENTIELQLFATKIASSRILISPMEDYQIFKPATVNIIRDIAHGYSRHELSSRHYMTVRGVDYHVEKAKLAFGAKNSSHLVHMAHELLLV